MMVTKGISVGRDMAYILLGNDDIVTIDTKSGNQKLSLQLPVVRGGSLRTISAYNEEFIFLTTLSFLADSKCYYLRLPLQN